MAPSVPPGISTAGERWARRELERLRDARFAPAAVRCFVSSSLHRAADTRAERPQLVRQSRLWLATGATAWLALAAAGRQPFRRRARSGLAWWATVGVMLDWHLGMVETEDGHPRRLGPADALTLTRAWLIPVLADDPVPAALVTAGATDVLDGIAARATRPTRAGRDLEGLVDGLVLLAALRGAVRCRRLDGRIAGVEAARLAAGIAYATTAYLREAGPPSPSITRAGRLATPARYAGLYAAARGRRRSAMLLVAGSTAASLAALAESLRAHASRARRRPASTPQTTLPRPTAPTNSP